MWRGCIFYMRGKLRHIQITEWGRQLSKPLLHIPAGREKNLCE